MNNTLRLIGITCKYCTFTGISALAIVTAATLIWVMLI
jgi:hypothetical protein